MLPVLQLGPFAIQTYPLALVLAGWLALAVGARAAKWLGLDGDHIYNAGLYGLLAGIIAGRLAHVLAFWPAYRSQPLEIFGFNTTAFLLWPAICGAVAVAGWYIYSTYISGGSPLPRLWFQPAPSPEATPPLETAEAEGPQETRTAEPTAEGEPEAVVEPTPEPTWTRIELPTPRPAQLPSPTPETGVLVQAFVEADTYVEVTLDGESAYIGILGPGETAEWRADEQVTLRVGNAGGIRLVVNGYDVGALGASGQVLTVEYSADSLPGR